MINLILGIKTLECFIFDNVFRDEGTPIACAYGVNVETIEMNTSFGTEITLQTLEAKKLLDYFEKLKPRVSLGLRTQMKNKIDDIILQLTEQGEPIT